MSADRATDRAARRKSARRSPSVARPLTKKAPADRRVSATQETGRRRRTELPRSSRCRAHHHESRDKHDDRARRRLTIEERVRRADRERLLKSEPPIECPRITSPVTAVASHRRRAPQTARTDRVTTAPRASRRQRRPPHIDRSSPPWPRSHDTDRPKRCGGSDADRDLWQRLQARRTPRAEGARARRDALSRAR